MAASMEIPMTRSFETGGAPHLPPKSRVASVMLQVLMALIPGVAAYCWYFGPGVLLQILLATLFALGFEALMLRLRGRPLKPFINDYSVVVTAVLFALCIPPSSPWWVSFTGMLFGVVFAKHLYGGLGQNPFNPAMVAFVVALICFPQAMTAWSPPLQLADNPPGLYDSMIAIASGNLPGAWDTATQATPLDLMKNGIESGSPVVDIRRSEVFGTIGGLGWEWIAIGFALGGVFLLYRRIISWQVPAGVLGGAALFSLLFWLTGMENNPSPLDDLFSGALMLAAFFIATDPVSGCTSPRGRLIFGFGVGVITLIIRRWGGYPDGVAFAVLLMNMAAPLIDRYTRPRIYGQ
jgi:electron transport complex protein RnfD